MWLMLSLKNMYQTTEINTKKSNILKQKYTQIFFDRLNYGQIKQPKSDLKLWLFIFLVIKLRFCQKM